MSVGQRERTGKVRGSASGGFGQSPKTKAPRKGESRKQSSELFSGEGDSPRGGEMSQRDRGDGPD